MLNCRILVVEDERIVALNLQQRLNKLGYDVPAIVASGDAALEKMGDLRPDLVLMDINIEGSMDGIETVRNMPLDLDIPVIYLTAYSEDSTLERARDTRPYGYLVKPFSERALHATIQMAMERRSTDIALKESEERLRLAMDAADMGSWEMELSRHKVLRMEPADKLLGFTQMVFTTTWESFLDRVHPDDQSHVNQALEQAIAANEPFQVEFRNQHASGEVRWLKIQGNIFTSRKDRRTSRIIGIIQDISEHRKAEIRLREAAIVFESSPDGIVVLDCEFHIVNANQSYCNRVGRPLEDISGKRLGLLLEDLGRADRIMEIDTSLRMHGQWSGELVGRHISGELLHMLSHIAAVRDRNNVLTHYVAVFSDLTAMRNAEQKLFHLAHHDPLTGLPNRLLARERLERSLERAKRLQLRVALLFVDLDYFKRVNDTLGHDVGDELLRSVAQRMQTCVRSEDTVSRQGGDEFMVILDHIEDIEDAVTVAKKITTALDQQFYLQTTELHISTSIGISIFPDNNTDADGLISAADSAMYVAKEQGRNRWAFYSAEMTARTARHMELDQELRHALRRDEFVLHYQPQFCMRTGYMVGVEALIRWQHPQKGLLGADEIIPVAEDNDLIIDIGEWVLHKACAQASAWREAGLPPIRVAVNVSARQMRDKRFIGLVRKLIAEHEIPPGLLEVEITESTLQNGGDFMTSLEQLKEIGVLLAIDDFGTGYSCLGSLKHLPIDRVKIDRVFVRDMDTNPNDIAITSAIIAMAHRMQMKVVAEGVESAKQAKLLNMRGCDEVQGYLYAKPLPPAALERFLLRQNRRR